MKSQRNVGKGPELEVHYAKQAGGMQSPYTLPKGSSNIKHRQQMMSEPVRVVSRGMQSPRNRKGLGKDVTPYISDRVE